MAQYLLSVWHDQDYDLDFSSEQAQRQFAQVGEFNADLDAALEWARRGADACEQTVEVRPFQGE